MRGEGMENLVTAGKFKEKETDVDKEKRSWLAFVVITQHHTYLKISGDYHGVSGLPFFKNRVFSKVLSST
jgi:aminoglycoside phosphotransferase family enzyme